MDTEPRFGAHSKAIRPTSRQNSRGRQLPGAGRPHSRGCVRAGRPWRGGVNHCAPSVVVLGEAVLRKNPAPESSSCLDDLGVRNEPRPLRAVASSWEACCSAQQYGRKNRGCGRDRQPSWRCNFTAVLLQFHCSFATDSPSFRRARRTNGHLSVHCGRRADRDRDLAANPVGGLTESAGDLVDVTTGMGTEMRDGAGSPEDLLRLGEESRG